MQINEINQFRVGLMIENRVRTWLILPMIFTSVKKKPKFVKTNGASKSHSMLHQNFCSRRILTSQMHSGKRESFHNHDN